MDAEMAETLNGLIDNRPEETNQPEEEPQGLSVEYIAEKGENVLQDVSASAIKRRESITMRIHAQFFHPITRKYVGWRGVAWKFAVDNIEGARRTQRALECLFDMIALVGVESAAREMEIVLSSARERTAVRAKAS